ncbi:MAG: hypothetical protein R3351_09005, partial [Nitrospirales bacterium]|nr:hypothetical protein [Nitrospirales bacterium]
MTLVQATFGTLTYRYLCLGDAHVALVGHRHVGQVAEVVEELRGGRAARQVDVDVGDEGVG